MADGGLSCPLCLVANDPADMLGVVVAHAVPTPDALIGLCKRCVLAIVKTAMATELISPAEIFGADFQEANQSALQAIESWPQKIDEAPELAFRPADPDEEPPDDMPDSERALLYPRTPEGDKEK